MVRINVGKLLEKTYRRIIYAMAIRITDLRFLQKSIYKKCRTNLVKNAKKKTKAVILRQKEVI